MDGDLVLFYELEGFKQNHRRYKPSFALPQLRYGNAGAAKPEEESRHFARRRRASPCEFARLAPEVAMKRP
mgnify:CR=1 FL=1